MSDLSSVLIGIGYSMKFDVQPMKMTQVQTWAMMFHLVLEVSIGSDEFSCYEFLFSSVYVLMNKRRK